LRYSDPMKAEPLQQQRLDKWLWAARFYKTRALAVQQVKLGRVRVAGHDAKPARELRVGDAVWLRRGRVELEVVVQGLSNVRGPAPVAQQLYVETPDSQARRERAAASRRLAPEPAHAIGSGRPTKRDRRALDRERRAALDARWSAVSASRDRRD